MGKHSNLGPIDPQVNGMPAHGVVEEFQQAINEVRAAIDPDEKYARLAIWQPIIAKYNPTLIGQCQKAITWSQTIVAEWLRTGMFLEDREASSKADFIAQDLGDHAAHKSHSRHIHRDKLKSLGLNILELESDGSLQNAVLAVHHASILTLIQPQVVKIIENQNGVGVI